MWLPRTKVPEIAREMLNALVKSGDIETKAPSDVVLDLESVLLQYISDEQAVTDKAKDLLAARSLPSGELGKMKRLVAQDKGIKIGEEAIDYLLDQLLEMVMHSTGVEEVYAEDVDMRLKLRGPLRKAYAADQEIDTQVRGRMKHVEEGTQTWEVEYQRIKDDIRRRRDV